MLKVANPAESQEELSFQTSMMNHVAGRDRDLPIPRVLRNKQGTDQFSIVDEAGQTRQVRLLSYLDGTPLADTTSNSHGRIKIGEVLGKLRLAMADFSHPSDTRVLAWDVKHLLALEYLLGEVQDLEKRQKLTTGMERFATLSERIAACRTQVVHNDFSQSNIVVDHDDPEFVTGIIDFGDAVRTAVAIDVSTALLNQLPRSPDENLFGHGHDVLSGYLSVADLTEEELMLIPHLVMGRVVTRALLSIWRARLFPDNSVYILRNTDQGWHQLDWFLKRSVDAVSATLL